MTKLLLYILIFFGLIINSYANVVSNGIDQLPPQFYNALDSAKIFIDKNPAKSVIYLETALNFSIKFQHSYYENQCYILLGKANLNLKFYDQAIRYFEKASSATNAKLSIKKTSINPQITEGLALAYEGKANYSKANYYILQLEKNRSYLSNSNRRAWINNFKGRIAYFSGNTKAAIAYFKLVSNAEKSITQHELVVEANDYLSNIYTQNNKKSQAKTYLSKSVDAAEKSENKDLLIKQGRKLKEAYKADNEFDKALELSSTTSAEESAVVKNKIQLDDANIYVKQNNLQKAIPLLEKTIIESEKLGQLEEKKEAYKVLSSAYQRQGNANKALENYAKYIKLQDSLYKQKEDSLHQLLTSQSNISEVNQRISLLEKNKELSEQKINSLETDRAFQKALIYGLVLIMTIIVLSSYLLYKNIKQKKIANQLLALKSLRSQMNPHFIFNALNSVNSFISANDQRTANKYLADFSKLMRSVLENSQQDFVALSEEIEVLELYLKLEHFRFSNKFDYTFEVADHMIEQYKIPPMLIQPYIENAVWHGLRYIDHKGMLSIKIGANSACIEVEIQDNGIGRKKSQALKTHNQKQNESMGLKNIETRLAIINDIYKTDLKVTIADLDPITGAGTKVNISIPFIKED